VDTGVILILVTSALGMWGSLLKAASVVLPPVPFPMDIRGDPMLAKIFWRRKQLDLQGVQYMI
jgi:hypothetical protein